MTYIRGYDDDTLHEIVDEFECRGRLDAIGGQRSLPALMERVWLLKVLGELDEALTVAESAVRQARMAGTRKDLLRARILHATVLQNREQYAAAENELTTCAEEAEGQGWSGIAAFAVQHRGKVQYDRGDYEAARSDFKQALFLRQESGATDDELQVTLQAVDAADRRRVRESITA
jgi:tetratricopeptide (TPR) repeat protein